MHRTAVAVAARMHAAATPGATATATWRLLRLAPPLCHRRNSNNSRQIVLWRSGALRPLHGSSSSSSSGSTAAADRGGIIIGGGALPRWRCYALRQQQQQQPQRRNCAAAASVHATTASSKQSSNNVGSTTPPSAPSSQEEEQETSSQHHEQLERAGDAVRHQKYPLMALLFAWLSLMSTYRLFATSKSHKAQTQELEHTIEAHVQREALAAQRVKQAIQDLQKTQKAHKEVQRGDATAAAECVANFESATALLRQVVHTLSPATAPHQNKEKTLGEGSKPFTGMV